VPIRFPFIDVIEGEFREMSIERKPFARVNRSLMMTAVVGNVIALIGMRQRRNKNILQK